MLTKRPFVFLRVATILCTVVVMAPVSGVTQPSYTKGRGEVIATSDGAPFTLGIVRSTQADTGGYQLSRVLNVNGGIKGKLNSVDSEYPASLSVGPVGKSSSKIIIAGYPEQRSLKLFGSDSDVSPQTLRFTGLYGWRLSNAGQLDSSQSGVLIASPISDSILLYYAGTAPDTVVGHYREGFGTAMCVAGKLYFDDSIAIAVASPYYSTSGLVEVGKVTLYKWDKGTNSLRPTGDVLIGSSEYGHFGEAISSGNIFGIEQSDLLVSAPGAGPHGEGAVYIYRGGKTSFSTPDSVLYGSSTDGKFGYSLTAISDTSHKIGGIVVGAPNQSSNGRALNGAVNWYSLWEKSPAIHDSVISGTADSGHAGQSSCFMLRTAPDTLPGFAYTSPYAPGSPADSQVHVVPLLPPPHREGVKTQSTASSGFDLSIRPNPAQHSATIYIGGTQGVAALVEVFSPTGVKVRTLKTNPDFGPQPIALTLDCSDLPSGEYLVRVTCGERAQTRKLLVER